MTLMDDRLESGALSEEQDPCFCTRKHRDGGSGGPWVSVCSRISATDMGAFPDIVSGSRLDFTALK